MAQELPLFMPVEEIAVNFDHKLGLNDFRDLAEKYFRIGDFTRAERLCAKVLEHDATNPILLNIDARIKHQTNANHCALEIVEGILARDPCDYQAHCTRGGCLFALGQIDQAIDAFIAAIAIAPQEAEAFVRLGIALTRAGRLDEVQGCFEKAAQAAPHKSEAFSCLGLYHFRCGDLEGAIAAFLQAIENDDGKIQNYAGLKRAADEFLKRCGLMEPAVDNDLDRLPLFRTRQRSYAFRKLLPHNNVIGPRRVLQTGVDEFRPLMLKHLVNYYAERPASYPAFWNHPDVTLECHRDHLYVQDKQQNVIPTVLSHFEVQMLSVKHPYYLEKSGLSLVGSAPCRKALSAEPYIIMDIAGFFGHFLCDELPSLLLALTISEIRDMKIIVPRLNAVHFKFLDFLGFPKERLINWQELMGDTREPASTRIAEAWFPITLPLPLSLEIVRCEFNKHVPIPDSLGERKLYISRNGQRLLNESEIEKELLREGFEIVHPEAMEVADQLRLFSEARIIAGAIGSGMASMIWAPRGTAIIEIMSEARPVRTTYVPRNIVLMQRPKTMSQSLGHDFFRVSGKAVHELGPSKLLDHVTCNIKGRWQDVHFTNVLFTCDPAEVVHAVRIALEAQRLS